MLNSAWHFIIGLDVNVPLNSFIGALCVGVLIGEPTSTIDWSIQL